ncbi:MAG TPA: hypothetical protein VHY20_05865, partial [Pirellulales bacterium]|nr:hypothetical protein [Pirellulales bacterium]
VAEELHQVSREAVLRAERIRRPAWGLRLVIALLLAAIVAIIAALALRLRVGGELLQLEHFVTLLDSALASLVVIGAVIAFLVTLEVRLKRDRALAAIHELRALAHIVDMHQLTKDPERVTSRGPTTQSSPKRTMTAFELGRYLDYCSELLSLISKLGALYAQPLRDRVALEAVDQLANLTNGLSRNIWQKIIILESILSPGGPPPSPPSAQPPPPTGAQI